MKTTSNAAMLAGRIAAVGFVLVVMVALPVLLPARPAHAANFFVVDRSDDPNLTTTPTAGNCTSAANDCSLRGAITKSNSSAADDSVDFDIPASACNATTGVCTITPTTQLPSIIDTVTMDGYTQTGALANTSTTNTNNAQLKVEISGAAASGGVSLTPGLTVSGTSASGTVIRGLVINRFSLHGVFADAGASATVEGNFIGIDPTGQTDLGNGFNGVLVTSSNNRIGGAANAAQNVISGNGQDGVSVAGTGSSGNTIINNHIGTDADAIDPLGNTRHGVFVASASTIVGGNDQNTGNGAGQDDGTTLGEGNIISGNGGHGVLVDNIGAEGTKIQGNHIGVDRNGNRDVGNTLNGVRVSSASQVEIGGTVDGLGNTISANDQHGVEIAGTSSTFAKVQGNRIGVDYIGREDEGNAGDGVRLSNVSGATIGGTAAGARNLVSGNDANGVFISGGSSATNNKVEGNFIGTDVSGTTGLGNSGFGVRLEAPGSVIGGTASGARNVISDNGGSGVVINGSNSTGNSVQGNLIGTDVNGTVNLGNNVHGVFIAGAPDNTIGGTVEAAANTIAFNTRQGVFIGSCTCATGNRVLRNSIFDNGLLGIELGLVEDGPTPNDKKDPDTGPNLLQNFPEIASATTTQIKGTLDSAKKKTFTVQLFSSPQPNFPTGFGEGRTFLGEVTVKTNKKGKGSFTFDGAVPAGQVVTATATDPNGNTSELSQGREVQ